MSRYVVTGAAGFIGCHLCNTLMTRNDAVTAVDAMTDYYPRALKEANLDWLTKRGHLDFREIDVIDTDLPALLRGVDGVFHLAAQPGIRSSWGDDFDTYVRNNILASKRLFAAAASAGVRVVYASSSSIYGDAEDYPTSEGVTPRPISPYGITKLACEHLARAFSRASGLDAVGLRYFTVFGPRQRPDMAFARLTHAAVAHEAFTVLGDATQSRDFTYVGDVVTATIGAMLHGRSGTVYNVGGGAETTLNDVIELVTELSDEKVQIQRRAWAAGDVRRTASDTSLIRSDIGWRPITSVRDGLAAQLAWSRTNAYAVSSA
jgi:nucleoside-diphosphate-sugar epimerase